MSFDSCESSFLSKCWGTGCKRRYQQNIDIVSDPALKLTFDPPTVQHYRTNIIEMTLHVDSQIDSNRVGVRWYYPTALFRLEGQERDVINVVKGQRTTITKKFIPKDVLPQSIVNRRVNLAVEVNGFVAGQNYLSSAEVNFVTTPDLVITPELDSYKQEKNSAFIKTGSTIAAGVILFGIAGFFAARQLKSYLETDEVV
jgi:hypothetical protein